MPGLNQSDNKLSMSDHLHLTFEYDEKLGFYQWEKQQKQKLIVSVRIGVDVKKAALTDHLDSTIDYDVVDHLILNLLKERHFHLIETFAEEIANTLLKKWPQTWVEITVDKPLAIAHAKKISVYVKREGTPNF